MGIEKMFENVIKILNEEGQEIVFQKIDKESNLFRIYLKSVDINSKEFITVEIFNMVDKKVCFVYI
ncbi:MAG: hypothetical protein KH415_00570 [Clostridium sp.]|jgi:hypothetical protein|nr:hypothetical protein [Clostridium sp.]